MRLITDLDIISLHQRFLDIHLNGPLLHVIELVDEAPCSRMTKEKDHQVFCSQTVT